MRSASSEERGFVAKRAIGLHDGRHEVFTLLRNQQLDEARRQVADATIEEAPEHSLFLLAGDHRAGEQTRQLG